VTGRDGPPDIDALVPELAVSDRRATLEFYLGVLGLNLLYERPEEGFAFLALGRAQLMVYEIGAGRILAPEGARLERPFGRGSTFRWRSRTTPP
jgi:catechol 2,3-dioxygenase-like lactoylglutathione lyase family enzyme